MFKGCASGDMLLEKILEEDSNFLMDDSRHNVSLQNDLMHHLISSSPRHQGNHNNHHYASSVQVTNI